MDGESPWTGAGGGAGGGRGGLAGGHSLSESTGGLQSAAAWLPDEII